uniref:TSA: Wollemia nobilis Ref_Wollemi_Transcript_4100_2084 transcribed RNA sequence n=1 Tax=Wollemia nobilis TaxID=56998 RepID=A0A0C9S8N8_9CONI
MNEEEVQGLSGLKDGLLRPIDNDEEEQNKLSIDEMLQKWTGEFGWWQLRHFVLTSLAWTLEALHTMVMIFADRQPPWQCKTSVREGFSLINRRSDDWQFQGSCNPESSICSMVETSWEWTGGKGVSTVSEWGLICDDKYKVGVVQSMFFVGCLFGAGICGHLSDSSLGRKGVLTMVCALNAVLGVLTALSPNYWVYVTLRLFTGICTGGVGLSAYVLAMEPVGPSKRGPVGMSVFYLFSLGVAVLPAISYWCPTWRSLYVVTSIPSALFCLLVLPFVSESPRWYLVRGRLKDAMDVMRSIGDKNGHTLPEGVSLILDNEEQSREGEEASGNLLDVLTSPMTRTRIILMVFIWFACALAYYGLSLNVVNLSSNLYVSVFLNGIAEMPAFALTAALLNKFGRKAMLVSTMLLSGVSCIIGSVISTLIHRPGGSVRTGFGFLICVQVGCGLVGIFGMAGTYNLLYIYTSELFPTVVRNAALGLTSQAGHIGSIIAPLVVVTVGISPWLPLAIIGMAGIAGGILGVKLPETLNRPMYETMPGMEYGEKSIGEAASAVSRSTV